MFAPIGDRCSGARSCSVFAVVAESQVSNKILLSLQDGEAPGEPAAPGGDPAPVGAAWSGEPWPALPRLLLEFSCPLACQYTIPLRTSVAPTFHPRTRLQTGLYSIAIFFPPPPGVLLESLCLVFRHELVEACAFSRILTLLIVSRG